MMIIKVIKSEALDLIDSRRNRLFYCLKPFHYIIFFIMKIDKFLINKCKIDLSIWDKIRNVTLAKEWKKMYKKYKKRGGV